MGSFLVMMPSMFAFRSLEDTQFDPGRLASQVASGIGLLQTGTILKRGHHKGLTTAASLRVATTCHDFPKDPL
ncbi:MAG: MgtC/SapB family protein [Bacillota bacterium]